MSEEDGSEAMLNACLAAYEAVKKHGTSEMLLAARILLGLVGEQIAQDLQSPIIKAVNKNTA
ncbi:hypothetical protein MKK84_12985 [Methylobacterium sp. E-065]|uniref:hypothetical protein n=1 Tax=Methylobacterium sp. E-065 TaxID=2836583 RepID=UPI001FB8662D|nr:hypothetical protein [Methylobacterium sp. E-065]MCJ2018334.1 hypothetical protein [Methylobacterium sp. E-065]